MRYCTNCGQESSSKICLNCGVKNHKVPNFCSWCGAPLNKNASICVSCKEPIKIGSPIGFKIVDAILLLFLLVSFVSELGSDSLLFLGTVVFCIILLLPFVSKAIVRMTHKVKRRKLLRTILFSVRILLVLFLYLASSLVTLLFVFGDPLIGEWKATSVSIDGTEYSVETMYGERDFTLTIKNNHNAILMHPEEENPITFNWYECPEKLIGTEHEAYPFHPDGDYEYMNARILNENTIAFWAWDDPNTIYYFENVK